MPIIGKQRFVGEIIHGMTGTALHRCWKNMKSRCFNPNSARYKHYGYRGITICDEWLDSEIFMNWAINNGYEYGLTIDRIDVNGNYEPENCRWITKEDNHELMMSYNLENNLGLFTEDSKRKSKNALRNNLGKSTILDDGSGKVVFDSRGELIDHIVSITGRDRQSVKSHVNLCLKGKCETISGFKVYEGFDDNQGC